MALKCVGQLALRVCLAQLLLATSACATWTVTSDYALSMTTISDKYSNTDTRTKTWTIRPSADLTGKPLFTTTLTAGSNDVEVVQMFYSEGDINTSDLQPPTTRDWSLPSTEYLQEIFFTAPSSCPTQFTITTQTEVFIPTEAAYQVTPTSITTTTSTDPYGDEHIYITAYLPEGAAPLPMAQSVDPIYRDYLDKCMKPGATGAAPGEDLDGETSSDDDDDGQSQSAASSPLKGCTTLEPWVASVLASLFILGFTGLSSNFWF
ncbi:hypothetical protein B0J13DRAFT_570127 [Dactylonectria estremocensis]|uniref:Uncharacterized protein n=1 Tax=Dactylonectria estremocensis TaxID=1079267 RepID=A0A9P9DFP1_9HYPO|nr:hypothetical protein B0J13DRAFT_570127 [Dactylonectria estremocensis]